RGRIEAWGIAKRNPRNRPHHAAKLLRSAGVDAGNVIRLDSSAAPSEARSIFVSPWGSASAPPQADTFVDPSGLDPPYLRAIQACPCLFMSAAVNLHSTCRDKTR